MKRKVIRQRDSFTVTLPKKWVKEHSVDQTKVVDVEEDKESVVIKAKASGRMEGELVIESIDENLARYMLNNAYRAGYDFLRIKSKNKNMIKFIEARLNKYLGWQATEKTDEGIVIDNLTEPMADKFDSLFRRAFYILKEDMIILRDSFLSGKLNFEEIETNKEEINRIDNFCRRCISKRAVEKEKTAFYWQFISTLIWVHQQLYFMAKDLKGKSAKDRKASEITNKLIKAVDLLNHGFFGKDVKKISEVFQISRKIWDEKAALFKGKGNHLAYHYLASMARLVNLLCSPAIGILE